MSEHPARLATACAVAGLVASAALAGGEAAAKVIPTARPDMATPQPVGHMPNPDRSARATPTPIGRAYPVGERVAPGPSPTATPTPTPTPVGLPTEVPQPVGITLPPTPSPPARPKPTRRP